MDEVSRQDQGPLQAEHGGVGAFHRRSPLGGEQPLWTRFLGKTKDPYKLMHVDAKGNPVPDGERRSVRDRTVEEDCLWLRQVFRWAVRWRTRSGNYLMRENPARGFDAPHEANPRRPVASQDRYEAVRRVSDEVVMGKGRCGRSYLSELLDIANGTGRRISAICQLRYEDLQLSATGQAPYGAIRWPATTDKMGRESVAPVDPVVRRALDRILRERPGIGAAPLFPSPEGPAVAMTRHLADKWLRKGEKLAGLEPQRGSLWHAYRRGWATSRKHLPDVDVAATGGWSPESLRVLKSCYQQADGETMLRVVLGAGEDGVPLTVEGGGSGESPC